jgi:precorrin-6B methylase 2
LERAEGVPRVTGDLDVQTSVLEDLSTAVRYRRWLASLASPHLGERPIEIGSGTGDYAVEWAQDCQTFTCSEAEPERLGALKRRFECDDQIHVVEMHVPITTNADHTAVVAYNVLEHIPDDVAALSAMVSLVEPGGKVILIVPAFNLAMSRFDMEIGHQRRYTKESLSTTLTAAGLTIESIHYVNALGLVAWTVLMRGLRRRPRAGLALNLYDRILVPGLSWVESRWHPPFGQSIFAVAKAPGETRTGTSHPDAPAPNSGSDSLVGPSRWPRAAGSPPRRSRRPWTRSRPTGC